MNPRCRIYTARSRNSRPGAKFRRESEALELWPPKRRHPPGVAARVWNKSLEYHWTMGCGRGDPELREKIGLAGAFPSGLSMLRSLGSANRDQRKSTASGLRAFRTFSVWLWQK